MQHHIKIIVADDHQMFIDGISSILSGVEEIQIVAQAINGTEVLDVLQKYETDVILLDINMPKMNGLDTLRKLRKDFPEVQVLMLTMYNTREYISQVIGAGAKGYILKNTGKEELLLAINTVYKGETYFSKEITDTVMQSIRNQKTISDEQAQLSKREIEIIKLIAQENTTKEIAQKLFISVNTVETHRKNILSKLNVKNSAGVIKYALQNGILND